MPQVLPSIVWRNDLRLVLSSQVFQTELKKVFGMVRHGHQAVMRVLILEKYNVWVVLN